MIIKMINIDTTPTQKEKLLDEFYKWYLETNRQNDIKNWTGINHDFLLPHPRNRVPSTIGAQSSFRAKGQEQRENVAKSEYDAPRSLRRPKSLLQRRPAGNYLISWSQIVCWAMKTYCPICRMRWKITRRRMLENLPLTFLNQRT